MRNSVLFPISYWQKLYKFSWSRQMEHFIILFDVSDSTFFRINRIWWQSRKWPIGPYLTEIYSPIVIGSNVISNVISNQDVRKYVIFQHSMSVCEQVSISICQNVTFQPNFKPANKPHTTFFKCASYWRMEKFLKSILHELHRLWLVY